MLKLADEAIAQKRKERLELIGAFRAEHGVWRDG